MEPNLTHIETGPGEIQSVFHIDVLQKSPRFIFQIIFDQPSDQQFEFGRQYRSHSFPIREARRSAAHYHTFLTKHGIYTCTAGTTLSQVTPKLNKKKQNRRGHPRHTLATQCSVSIRYSFEPCTQHAFLSNIST